MNIYIDLPQALSQVEGMNRLCQEQQTIYEQLANQFQKFILETSSRSKAYDSAKQYFETVLLPLIRGGKLLSEIVIEVNNQFIKNYLSTVDYCSLNAAELSEQISYWENQIEKIRRLLKEVADSTLEPLNKAFFISENTTLLGMYGEIKSELNGKLNRLQAFNHYAVDLFDEIIQLGEWLTEGCQVVRKGWNYKEALFVIPEEANMGWADRINQAILKQGNKEQRISVENL
ncbi:hypothetical protein ACYSNR_02350 [Enterococcus sp. LJL128]